jgi:hypothetical protein
MFQRLVKNMPRDRWLKSLLMCALPQVYSAEETLIEGESPSVWGRTVLGRQGLLSAMRLAHLRNQPLQPLEYVRTGDKRVVWRLDYLDRPLTQLIALMTQLDERGVEFRSLTEQIGIGTTTSGGKLIFRIFGAFTEFERSLIRERTMTGLQATRARGRKGGRPKLLDTDRKVQMARKLYRDSTNSGERSW